LVTKEGIVAVKLKEGTRQFLKAESPKKVTLGIKAEINWVQFRNPPDAMLVTKGNEMEINPVPSNALVPREVTEFGIVMETKLLQNWNA